VKLDASIHDRRRWILTDEDLVDPARHRAALEGPRLRAGVEGGKREHVDEGVSGAYTEAKFCEGFP